MQKNQVIRMPTTNYTVVTFLYLISHIRIAEYKNSREIQYSCDTVSNHKSEMKREEKNSL